MGSFFAVQSLLLPYNACLLQKYPEILARFRGLSLGNAEMFGHFKSSLFESNHLEFPGVCKNDHPHTPAFSR